MGRPWEVFEVENPWVSVVSVVSQNLGAAKLWMVFVGWILDEIGLISRRHEIFR